MTSAAAGQATTPSAATVADEKQVALSSAAASSLAAEEMLAAAADLTAVRARIAADTAAFATAAHDDAKQLAREASRAERVANFEQARFNVTQLEQELSAAKAGTDDESKKKGAALPNKLAEAINEAMRLRQPLAKRARSTRILAGCIRPPARGAARPWPAGSVQRPTR